MAPLPAVLCGMVGSAIGWLEAPYLPCPAELYELAENPGGVRDGVFIVPGMRCSNPLGAPDVMRGEETQLLGARRLRRSLNDGKQLVCMPGTHTKWVSLHDRRGAGIPDGAHRRVVRACSASTACWCATRPRPSSTTPRGFRARARGVGAASGGAPAAPAVPEPQPAHRQAAHARKARHRGCPACSSARM